MSLPETSKKLMHVAEAEHDFELTEQVKQKSQHQRLSLFESTHAVLKEKGDKVTEVSPKKYAEIILENMASSDHNYKIVAFEILKHTLAISYVEKPERLEKFLEDIKGFKEAAEKMKDGFGFVSFGEEGQQKKRVVKLIKILKETVVYLEKMKKLSDEEKEGFEKPESEKKLTRGQKALLKRKGDLRKELMKLEKELEVKWKVPKEDSAEKGAKVEGDAEVIDLDDARKKKAAAKAAEAVTLKPEEEKKHDEAVGGEVVAEEKAANG